MKIAFVCGHLNSFGEDFRIVSEQVIGLRARGHQVDLYRVSGISFDSAPEAMAKLNVHRILPLTPSAKAVPSALSTLAGALFAPANALRMRHAEVIFGWGQGGTRLAYLLARLLNRPYVSYRNRTDGPGFNNLATDSGNGSARRGSGSGHLRSTGVVARIDREAIDQAASILASGSYVAQQTRSAYGREATVCAEGCRPHSKRVLRLDEPQLFDGAFKLNERVVEKPYLLVIGQDQSLAQLDTTFQLLANVTQAVPGAFLVIAGVPAADPDAVNRIASQQLVDDRFLMTGAIPEADLQRLFREAAVYCHLEPDCGSALWVLEAMSWGIPVVAWNQLTTRSLVENGRTGFLAQTGSLSAFASAVAWLLQDPDLRWRLGAEAWERAGKLFSWDGHLDLLERALTESITEIDLEAAPDGSAHRRPAALPVGARALAVRPQPDPWNPAATELTTPERADPAALQEQSNSPLFKEIST